MLDNLHVGATGLAAASAGFNATAQNVSNVRTPGFGRRAVDLSIADPIGEGPVRMGNGVRVQGIQRTEAGLLGVQIIGASGTASRSATLNDALAQVEPLLDESLASGPRTEIAAFFDALNLATADPSDPGLRDTVLEAATDVARSIQQLARGLEQIRAAFSESLEIEIPPLSQKLQQVAILNRRLLAAGGANAAPDIADKLNRLLRELGEDGGFAATIRSDGTAAVLLDGNAAATEVDARRLMLGTPNDVQIAIDGGAISVRPGGRLGGLVEAYDKVSGYLEQLDTLAAGFADAVNAVQAGGFDQDGNPGSPLFTFDPANPSASLSVAPGLSGRSLAFAADPTAAAGDGTRIASFLDLEASLNPGRAMSQLINAVSLDAATAGTQSERDQYVVSDLDALNQRLNGVNLDEEALNLTAYQTAYQASARVLNVANDLIGTLLEIT